MNRLTRQPAGALAAEVTATPRFTEPTQGEPPAWKPYAEARALLDDFAGRGITVELAPGGALHVRPKSAVTAEDRERLVSGKAEIVALLGADVEVLEPPRKKPIKVGLATGDHSKHRSAKHKGEPRPTPERPYSASGAHSYRERFIRPLIAHLERRPIHGAVTPAALQAARERLGRWGQ